MQEEKMLCFRSLMMPGLEVAVCDIDHRGVGNAGFSETVARCTVCNGDSPP
jgi:hypothetical protein